MSKTIRPQHSSDYTAFDMFCGAGGTSEGMSRRGVRIKAAANHEQICVRTHNTNFPDADHYLTDVSLSDMRKFPRARLLFASPECTDWSLAQGVRRRNMGQLDLWGDDGLDPAAERTRVTMWDPLRYCDTHDPDGGMIENVVEVPIYWRLWDTWLKGWGDLGYETQVLYLNSMFAHPRVRPDGTYSMAAPQSRDRVYVVFKKRGLGKPLNIKIMPWAWCAHCGVNVQSIQSWKPNAKHGRKGRYGATKQYVYRCPACTRMVEPYYWCAANAIDWATKGERIGDRKRPLAAKTTERIQYGLTKFGGRNPFLAGAYHCIPPWVRTLDGPLGTVTSQDHHQLVHPEPFIVGMSFTQGNGGYVTEGAQPFPTQTARHDKGVVSVDQATPTRTAQAEIGLMTPSFVVSNYNGPSRHPVKSVDEATPTMATGSGVLNHALVVPPFMVHPNKRNVRSCEAVDDVFPTQTSDANHALIVPSGGTWADMVRDVSEALPTHTASEALPTHTASEAYGFLLMERRHNTLKGLDEALDTVVGGGNHHALIRPFMLDYKGQPRSVAQELPTQTAIVGDGVVEGEAPAIEDCSFRMLMVSEVKAAMAFRPDYTILGTKREQTMQCGQAVTPPAAELLGDALIDALEGVS